jgi:hypothetical protein
VLHDRKIEGREDISQTQWAGGMTAASLDEHLDDVFPNLIGLQHELLVRHSITITFFEGDGYGIPRDSMSEHKHDII